MNVSSELDVTGSSAGSATVIGDAQGTVYPVVTPVVPLTLGLAVGADELLGFTTDEALNTANMSGPSVGHIEEVATTGSAPIAAIQRLSGTVGPDAEMDTTTIDPAAVHSTSGKLRSLVIHVDLITGSGNQINNNVSSPNSYTSKQ